MVDHKELRKGTRALLNTFEGEASVIPMRIDRALQKATDDEDLRRMLAPLVEDSLRQLRGVLDGLQHPVVIIDIEVEEGEHPCDGCEVTLNNLSPDEHCHGCTHEAELQTYVKDTPRPYLEATEASTEED